MAANFFSTRWLPRSFPVSVPRPKELGGNRVQAADLHGDRNLS
jgi:hypothetical protein